MPSTEDRLTMLRMRADTFTGIDFVQVVDACDQKTLRVYFLTDPRALSAPFEDVGDPSAVAALELGDIRIYSPRGAAPDAVLVPSPSSPSGLAWVDDADSQRRVLELSVAEPGTFTDYRLHIDDARIDRAFNDVHFSFKAGCDTRLDCAEPARGCAGEPSVDFPVDYLARDFVSLRNALLDYGAQRYPGWQLPREADVGTMLLEVLAALGDELGYVQERLHRESGFEEATERRTLRRKARLVDHEIHDGRMASTWLELAVLPTTTFVEGGWPVWVRAAGQDPVAFEIGRGMIDHGVNFLVDERWNPGRFTPYALDDSDACLAIGATELLVRNDPANPDNPGGVSFDQLAADAWVGRTLLLRRTAKDVSELERLVAVRVAEVVLETDALFGIDIARIRWDHDDALKFEIELDQLELSGNLVPATAGASRKALFRIGPLSRDDVNAGVIEAVEREGPLYSNTDRSVLRRDAPCRREQTVAATRPPIYLLSLPDTDAQGLAFADSEHDLRRTLPELQVHDVTLADATPDPWQFRRTLLIDGSDDRSFTLEDGMWRRIVAYPRSGDELVHRDYATSAGYTVRFGDGEFGQLPTQGSLFLVEYRLGGGERANVPAGSVCALVVPGEPPSELSTRVSFVRNPFPVTDGVNPESIEAIKQVAPHAYSTTRFFAVRPEDYGEQAQTLDFVQRAHASFRWTGSWLSAITAADPRGAFELTREQRARLDGLLDARRQAGRDVIVADPKFVDLDFRITLCVAQSVFPAHVESAVNAALFGHSGPQQRKGFFHPDRFTFGTPLQRSALEAALQRVPGVEAVIGMQVRSVGVTDFTNFDALTLAVADDEVIRVENDPARPERGTVALFLEGGA